MADRILCSLFKGSHRDISADFTAKTSPELLETAMEMVAEEPRPTVQPLVHQPIVAGGSSALLVVWCQIKFVSVAFYTQGALN